MEFCKELAELLLDIAQETSDLDPEQKARIWKNAAQWKERSTRERILNDAAGLRIVSSSDLDTSLFVGYRMNENEIEDTEKGPMF